MWNFLGIKYKLGKQISADRIDCRIRYLVQAMCRVGIIENVNVNELIDRSIVDCKLIVSGHIEFDI